MERVVGIIQARRGSRRLPGKMLEPIQGVTLLGHVLARAGRIRGLADLVVATSTRAGDDAIAEEARGHGVAVFRGDEDDVLGRYVACARTFGARDVLRVCGDCVVLDPGETERLLHAHAETGADCTHNKHARGAVWGAGAEVIRLAALERAERETTRARDREHVTPYVREETARFTTVEVDAAAAHQGADLDLSIDTADDLAAIRALADDLPVPLRGCDLARIIDTARRHGVLRRLSPEELRA